MTFASFGASAAETAPLLAIDWKAELSGEGADIAIIFDRPTEYEILYLTGPNRIIIELPETSFGFERESTKPEAPFTDIRYGAFDEETSRIVLTLAEPMIVDGKPEDIANNFAVIENGVVAKLRLSKVDSEAFSARASEQLASRSKPAFAPKKDRIGEAAPKSNKVFSLVIDPGHGGIDGGAEGKGGTKEKNLTLAFAKTLQSAFAEVPNVRVTLTRTSDQFVRLRERVRIARQAEADLLISVHADSIQYRNIAGATIYTLSEKATDRISAKIARQENNADLLAGLPVETMSSDVSDILLDLLRDETTIFSEQFADALVMKLKSEKVRMIKNPHRRAGFTVLSAPDVPSVLVELGYLSNVEDEKRMSDPKWRENIANYVALAIKQFAQKILASRL